MAEDFRTELRKKLEEVKDKFDYMIIDCPPSLGTLTTNLADLLNIPKLNDL